METKESKHSGALDKIKTCYSKRVNNKKKWSIGREGTWPREKQTHTCWLFGGKHELAALAIALHGQANGLGVDEAIVTVGVLALQVVGFLYVCLLLFINDEW